MRRVVRCHACSSCARVAGCGFVARERLWFVEAKRWVDPDSRRPRSRRQMPPVPFPALYYPKLNPPLAHAICSNTPPSPARML